MVNQQGEQLDLASDNVMSADSNVSQARENLATSEKVSRCTCAARALTRHRSG